MNRNWEHCEEKPEKSGIDVIRKGERMLESVARWVFPCTLKRPYAPCPKINRKNYEKNRKKVLTLGESVVL